MVSYRPVAFRTFSNQSKLVGHLATLRRQNCLHHYLGHCSPTLRIEVSSQVNSCSEFAEVDMNWTASAFSLDRIAITSIRMRVSGPGLPDRELRVDLSSYESRASKLLARSFSKNLPIGYFQRNSSRQFPGPHQRQKCNRCRRFRHGQRSTSFFSV